MEHESLFAPILTPTLLANSLNFGGDGIAIEYESQRISRFQLRNRISQYCAALKKLNIGAGTRVAFLSDNRPELLYFTCAALISGVCIVPLHSMGSAEDHAFICTDADADAIVFQPKFEASARLICERIPSTQQIALYDKNSLDALASTCPITELVSAPMVASEVCRLSYTGGTTGRPKAAEITYRAFLHMLMVQLLEWEWPTEIRHLVCAPLSHAAASAVLPTLLRGGTLIVLSNFTPTAVLQAVEHGRVTSALMVPSMLYKILDEPTFERYDLSSLETVFYGASAISPKRLQEAITKIGPVFYQFYAQAEAPMVVTALRRNDHISTDLTRLGSCGRAMPWVEVALLDSHCLPVETGQAGELCIRGPIVMAGYRNRPEETSEALDGGWLHTGDIATKDEQGFIFIVDRKKDMIISGGFNVYSRQVEDALCNHAAVAQATVYGVPSAAWGEEVHAAVVLKAGWSVEEDDLKAYITAAKGKLNTPKTINFIADLPLTDLGKPDKKLLRLLDAGLRLHKPV